MKSLIIIALCLVLVPVAKGQQGCPSPFGKTDESLKRFQIGAGLGLTTFKGERKSANAMGTAGYFNFDYQFAKGLSVGIRTQYGSFKISPNNFDSREMDSRYFGYGAGILIHPFEVINGKADRRNGTSIGRNIAEDFYFGVDILNVSNRFNYIYRNLADQNTYGPIEGYDANGEPIFKNKVNSLMLPSFNIGLAPTLNRSKKGHTSANKNVLRLVLNAQFNFAIDDELDGYTPYGENMNKINEKNDVYNFYSLGLRYSF